VIDMAVSLPTAADVRKVREQAAKTAAERAEVARTPLLAVLGAGDLAYNAAVRAFANARARADERAEKASELPAKFTTEELRKAVDELRAHAKEVYAEFAERGEKAWGKFRAQPQVKQAVSTLGTYTGKLDARVDALVDDAHDVAEKALATVSRQTRATGEKFAQATKRYSDEAAEDVTEATKDVSAAVTDAGTKTAGAVAEAGDEVATTTRSTTRKAANRTRPATTTPKTAE
jgi:heparin binding hemagglutinin HbhA